MNKLELANNRIATVQELAPLKELKALQRLDVDQCPLAKTANYSEKVFTMLDELKYLDSVDKEGRGRSPNVLNQWLRHLGFEDCCSYWEKSV